MVASQRRLRSVGTASRVGSIGRFTSITSLNASVPHGCIVGAGPARGRPGQRESADVDVRIGIVQSIKELEVELGDDAERDSVIADIEESLSKSEGVLWLTDRRGRRVAVPVAKVAYVEVGAPTPDRRVGFGAP